MADFKRATNILLRLVIIAIAGLAMWEFLDLIWLEMHHLDRPFNPPRWPKAYSDPRLR